MHLEEEDAGIVVTFWEILTTRSIADKDIGFADKDIRVKYMTPNTEHAYVLKLRIHEQLAGTAVSIMNSVDLTLVNTNLLQHIVISFRPTNSVAQQRGVLTVSLAKVLYIPKPLNAITGAQLVYSVESSTS